MEEQEVDQKYDNNEHEDDDENDDDDGEKLHRKKLLQILRYIASIHESSDENRVGFFVRDDIPSSRGWGGVEDEEDDEEDAMKARKKEQYSYLKSDFFQIRDDEKKHPNHHFFSTNDFRDMLRNEVEDLFPDPPFTFYSGSSSRSSSQASPSSIGSKRTPSGAMKPRGGDDASAAAPSWLRLSRPPVRKSSPPSFRRSDAIKDYLRNWRKRENNADMPYHRLLTLENLRRAPKIDPNATTPSERRQIVEFLRRYQNHLKRERIMERLEPLYNTLFEWIQESEDHELVWGFGNARMILEDDDDDGTVVNGPIMEVLVEVEMCRDGSLLVRPREHAGVSVNREVLSAIAPTSEALATIHRAASELDPRTLAPGTPDTYSPFLRKVAIEISPSGSFVPLFSSSSSSSSTFRTAEWDFTKLVVTDSWCLFERPKPTTVWARDASALAKQLFSVESKFPPASHALTLGPSALDKMTDDDDHDKNDRNATSAFQILLSRMMSSFWGMPTNHARFSSARTPPPLLPLPSSEMQNRIVELLLHRQYPVIVCEGPPGSGKTQTIANVVCAYLARGKRVLVTSKSAPALGVLKDRLPPCAQQLCVDASMSETRGMQQLQRTVERLVQRLSCVSGHLHMAQLDRVESTLQNLDAEIETINRALEAHSNSRRKLTESEEGSKIFELGICIMQRAPWLAASMANLTVDQITHLHKEASQLLVDAQDPASEVSGFPSPPPGPVETVVARNAGASLASIQMATESGLRVIPMLGQKVADRWSDAESRVRNIRIEGREPSTQADWRVVLRAMRLDKAIHRFRTDVLADLVLREEWPEEEIFSTMDGIFRIRSSFVEIMEQMAAFKEAALKNNLMDVVDQTIECQRLDARQNQIETQKRHLAREMVDIKVMSQLNSTFDSDAQSALVRFAQVTGKAKLNRSNQVSKLSQRQRRYRQEYINAFEKCVRHIPCWILTTSQISDYLPAEFALFDLVIIDESSQSDITALPGLLRGSQWLVVGDGKQVSPTENFLSEAQIENLRSVLPPSPLEEALLPGRSLFDLCSLAFPKCRATINEHFRCAPEIISFSNEQFYDGRLVPLRLPTSRERLSPSIIDVRVRDGSKEGKVNEVECDKIVELIQEFVHAHSKSASLPRTIGVISLVGNHQSRLIRRRLLDAIGPQKYSEHQILVGEPPSFQGAERDVVFLSMVCSPSRVPTQNQLMHSQHYNVALTRARDRLVLVRSLDISHIPNPNDVKIPVLDFFSRASEVDDDDDTLDVQEDGNNSSSRSTVSASKNCLPMRLRVQALMEEQLLQRGYSVRRMGIVWENAICVEDEGSERRAAICLEGIGESSDEWKRSLQQQRSIERVGWKTIRLDALFFLLNYREGMRSITSFLMTIGVGPAENGKKVDSPMDHVVGPGQDGDGLANRKGPNRNQESADDDAGANDFDYLINSEEEEEGTTNTRRSKVPKNANNIEEVEQFDPSIFGDVVDLRFLGGLQRDGFHNNDDADSTVTILDRSFRQKSLHRAAQQTMPPVVFQEPKATHVRVEERKESEYQRPAKRAGGVGSPDKVARGAVAKDDHPESRHPRPLKQRRKSRKVDKCFRDGRSAPPPNKDEG